nr:hybrid sensor histidine kinase/response regulator [Verticiella sp. GG226]
MVLYWGEARALIYNDAWSPVPGRKHPWALGRPAAEVWAEIWDIIGPMFDHVMSTGEATWSEDQLLPLNRYGYVEECYFYYSYSPVRGENGDVEGIFTAVTETTLRVLSERRERLLREVSEQTSQARTAQEACTAAVNALTTMPEEAPVCLAYLREGPSGYRLVASAGVAAGSDLAPVQVDGSGAAAPWPLQTMLSTARATPMGGLAPRYPDSLPRAPWPEPIEEAAIVPIQSARAGEPHGFLVFGISARRRYDAAYGTLLERAAAHVSTAINNAEVYEAERRRAEQLAELDRAKTVFFSNASHEFRTPLTLMLGPLEDMLARDPDASGDLRVPREDIELVGRNGQRLLRLVNTLLDFSRIEAGSVRANVEPVDLSACTIELARSFEMAMERAGLTFRVVCEPLSRPVMVDRQMWEKIVLNLLSNAFKYTLSGHIEVRLTERVGAVLLQVEDSGVGIPPEELPRVFDRFHRIEGQVGRTHEGTGIGLALVKDLAALHDATVDVQSQVGVGSVFTVTLPFGTAPAGDGARAEPALSSTAIGAETFVAEALRWLPDAGTETPVVDLTPEPETEREQGQGERILLADDNSDMRGYVARLLQASGYRVQAVEDGIQAVQAALDDPPELILSDVMMPNLDGFGVIQALRADARTAELPIILLSARAGRRRRSRASKPGRTIISSSRSARASCWRASKARCGWPDCAAKPRCAWAGTTKPSRRPSRNARGSGTGCGR